MDPEAIFLYSVMAVTLGAYLYRLVRSIRKARKKEKEQLMRNQQFLTEQERLQQEREREMRKEENRLRKMGQGDGLLPQIKSSDIDDFAGQSYMEFMEKREQDMFFGPNFGSNLSAHEKHLLQPMGLFSPSQHPGYPWHEPDQLSAARRMGRQVAQDYIRRQYPVTPDEAFQLGTPGSMDTTKLQEFVRKQQELREELKQMKFFEKPITPEQQQLIDEVNKELDNLF